jgi:LacI family repressor for deo operon, udp, cdd, tsx, nupC, and nupG
VVADNLSAARAMTRHLIALGHKRIAFAFHPFHERDLVGRERLAGFEQAMAEAGLSDQASVLLDACEFGERQALIYHQEKIVECFRRSDHPTALFAGMDMLAIHVMETLGAMGLRIPHDVALAGFDNIAFSPFTQPPLTTVEQPTDEMGRLAASILFNLIESKSNRRGQSVCERLPCKLVIRKSCGASLKQKRT